MDISREIDSVLDDTARVATAAILQSAPVDLIDLSLIAKQAHWNVVGAHFKVVHEHLDDLVDQARQQADQVAERAVAIGAAPDGREATGACANTSTVRASPTRSRRT